jgi:hypothetical protein
MDCESGGPFESIEGAQEYMRLLYATVLEVRQDVEADAHAQTGSNPQRRLEALKLVLYKLENLEKHLKTVQRTLNDLRTLRRLLLAGRGEVRQILVNAASESEIQEFDGAC